MQSTQSGWEPTTALEVYHCQFMLTNLLKKEPYDEMLPIIFTYATFNFNNVLVNCEINIWRLKWLVDIIDNVDNKRKAQVDRVVHAASVYRRPSSGDI